MCSAFSAPGPPAGNVPAGCAGHSRGVGLGGHCCSRPSLDRMRKATMGKAEGHGDRGSSPPGLPISDLPVELQISSLTVPPNFPSSFNSPRLRFECCFWYQSTAIHSPQLPGRKSGSCSLSKCQVLLQAFFQQAGGTTFNYSPAPCEPAEGTLCLTLFWSS